ncbi:hypothetical protein [Streptomyces sp. NPDC046197]|uniref:hypothetical protein n=1 Tax=Streptomyces sp. NPDC046197 TaxID=3154337 RepID=UPI0033D7E7E1
MSVEEHDPFEDRFATALRDAGGTFETDQQDLVAAGERRGRRLRLRRRAALAGGVTSVALVGLGGALVLPGGHADGARQRTAAAGPTTPGTSTTPRTGATRDDVLRILEKALPPGRFSGEEGRGTETDLPPYALVVYDDGKGKAAVAVTLDRFQPGGQHALQTTQCPDKVFIAYDACTSTKLADGSSLVILKGYEYPNRRSGTKLWTADLVTPAGEHIGVQEWNSAAEKDSPVTRAEPPLSAEQLTALVGSHEWRAVMDALPAPPKERQPAPTRKAPNRPVSTTLASLLPKGLRILARSGKDAEFGYVVVDDGRGASLAQVNVQPDMSDVEGQLFGSDARTLPDGTKVATHQRPGEKGGAGVVMWTVDTIRPDGFRVVISAFNSGAQNTPASRTAPALTMRQLESIATSPKWRSHG